MTTSQKNRIEFVIGHFVVVTMPELRLYIGRQTTIGEIFESSGQKSLLMLIYMYKYYEPLVNLEQVPETYNCT